jgi:hypothetical protein
MSKDAKSAPGAEGEAAIARLHEECEWLRQQLAEARNEIAILELQVCQAAVDEWIEHEKKHDN